MLVDRGAQPRGPNAPLCAVDLDGEARGTQLDRPLRGDEDVVRVRAGAASTGGHVGSLCSVVLCGDQDENLHLVSVGGWVYYLDPVTAGIFNLTKRGVTDRRMPRPAANTQQELYHVTSLMPNLAILVDTSGLKRHALLAVWRALIANLRQDTSASGG